MMSNGPYDIHETRRQINNQRYLVHLFIRKSQIDRYRKHSVNIFKRGRNAWHYISGEEFDFNDEEKVRERYKFIIEHFKEHMMESIL